MTDRLAYPGPLGCGDYHVEIRSRGGQTLIDVLEWSHLTFGRKVDAITTATVGLSASQSAKCCGVLSKLKAWRYELAVYRNGLLAWAGPLKPPSYSETSVTVNAADLFAWFERRSLVANMNFPNQDLSKIFADIAQAALDRDSSPNITIVMRPTGVDGERKVTGFEFPRASDLLGELSRSGVDWSMVGRELRGGGVEVPTAPLATLIDDMVRDVKIDPIEGASQVIVTGRAADATHALPIYAVSTSRDGIADIGLVEVVYSEPDILDDRSCQAAADTRRDFFDDDPVDVVATLMPDAPIDFRNLVPGARIDLALSGGCRPVMRPARLTAVDVTVSANDTGVTEDVVATFGPLGTVAA